MRQIIQTDDAPAAIGPYSQAVRAGDLVFVSGQIPLDPDGAELVGDTPAEQAAQCMRNVAAVAEAAGTSLDSAVRLTIYTTDLGRLRRHQRGLRGLLRRRAAGAGGRGRGRTAQGRAGGDRRGAAQRLSVRLHAATGAPSAVVDVVDRELGDGLGPLYVTNFRVIRLIASRHVTTPNPTSAR